jgi:Tfp pilus assembly protein PilO
MKRLPTPPTLTGLSRLRLPPALAKIGPWWAQRPARDRWMLLGAFIVATFVAIDTLWTAPLEKRLRRAASELAEREENVNKAARQPASQSPEQAKLLREQETALRQRLQEAQAAAAKMGQQTQELPQLLRTLTGQGGVGGSLRLVALELQPDPSLAVPANAANTNNVATVATNLLASAGPAASAALATLSGTPGSAAPSPATDNGQRRLYRLPVNLTVSGSYDDLQRLMQSIERDAPSLQWASMSLDSSDWPAIKLTLRAQAVSLRPTWSSGS